MKRSSMMSVLAALALAVVMVGPAFANNGADFQKMQQVMAELGQKSGQDFEIAYINAIIPHHQDATAMAKMVKDDAPHQEIRDMANKMIADQDREIADLTNWLKQWYGQDVSIDARMKMDPAMMDMLMKADPAMKEKMFMSMMREHHQSAIDMGKMVINKATHQELKDQAQMMMTMQKDEQDRLGNWLQSWYNITAPTPTGDMQHGMDAAMAQPAPTTAPVGAAPGSLPNTGASTQVPWWTIISLIALGCVGGGLLVRRSVSRA